MHHLEIENLTHRYRKGKFSLGPLSFAPPIGITSVVGINGAGKTTLFNLIAGAFTPQSGSISVATQRSVGFLPQNPIFPRHANTTDILRFAAWLHGIEHPEARIELLIKKLGLEDHKKKSISQLSGGMQRRVGLAQALIHDPQIVLLDEPTAGLDPIQRIAVRTLIQEELAGHTVLLSTHLVEDIRALSDSVLVLDRGQCAFTGTLNELESLSPESGPKTSSLETALNQLYAGASQ